MLSPGTFGHGGAYGTQAWVDPARRVAYVLMVQRANFSNGDASDVRGAFRPPPRTRWASLPAGEPGGGSGAASPSPASEVGKQLARRGDFGEQAVERGQECGLDVLRRDLLAVEGERARGARVVRQQAGEPEIGRRTGRGVDAHVRHHARDQEPGDVLLAEVASRGVSRKLFGKCF